MNQISVTSYSYASHDNMLLGEEILSLLNRVIPVTGSCFYEVDSNMVATHQQMRNLDESWLGAYRECFFEYDPLHPSRFAERHTAVATLHTNLEGCDRKTREYLIKFLFPQNTPYQLEIYFRHAGRIIAGASLVRGSEMGIFSNDEITLLKAIVPFLEFALGSNRERSPEKRLAGFGLSPREREIVELVTQGLSNKEICRRLDLELPTVKTYLSRIFAKTGARTRTALLHQLFLAH